MAGGVERLAAERAGRASGRDDRPAPAGEGPGGLRGEDDAQGLQRLLRSLLGVRVVAGALGLPTAPRALLSRAERWRPWRSYAVQLLWASGDHAVTRLPDRPTQEMP